MDNNKIDFLYQLETYAKKGIPIVLEGYASTPEEIWNTCLLKEDTAYMCDYIFSDEGNLLRELHFDRVKNNKEE